MKQPKISVIVPVYNAEAWLQKAIDSCLKHTSANSELICVDDCSTDNSTNLIKNMQKKDQRIVLLENKNNVGPGSSRNAGIDAATGEYVAFIDNDDHYEPAAMQTLYDLITKYQTPAVFANWFVDKDGKQSPRNWYVDKLYTVDKEACAFFISPWGKLIKTDFIRQNNIRFGEGFVAEDRIFQISLLSHADKIYLCSQNLYHWNRNNESSITKTNFNKGEPRDFAYIKVAEKCINIIRQNKPEIFNPEYEIHALYESCCRLPWSYFRRGCSEIARIIQEWNVSKADFKKVQNRKRYELLKSNAWIRIFIKAKIKCLKRRLFKGHKD